MKSIKHKFMAVLLCCLLAASTLLTTLAAFPETAEAAEVQPFWFYSENAYMTGVCKKGKTPSGDVVIPATFTYKGVKYKVTKIGNSAISHNTKVTSVTIPSTVRTIGEQAFSGCTKLKSVTISKKAELDSIGEYAFGGCASLKEIYINAETVGERAFWNCTSLSKVTFGSNVKKIGDYAFGITGITSITFGKNITAIGEAALMSCYNLETITIGENVTTLGGDISYRCFELKKITIESTKLNSENCGDGNIASFGSISKDAEITVPDGKSEEYGFLWTDNWVEEDGYVRFAIDRDNAYMTGICEKGETPSGEVKIPATFTYDGVNYKVTKIGDAFSENNKKITSVEIPSTVTEIGTGAFSGCKKLKTVTIPKKAKLSRIGESAFSYCTSLKEIYINAESVEINAFENCTSLAKVTFGDNVREIGEMAFSYTAFKSINFGKNITTIGTNAVYYCKKLEKITIGENVTEIGELINFGCKKTKTITVKSTKLKMKNCGGYGDGIGEWHRDGTKYQEPFNIEHSNIIIKVPKSKLSKYKKFLAFSADFHLGYGYDVTYKTF